MGMMLHKSVGFFGCVVSFAVLVSGFLCCGFAAKDASIPDWDPAYIYVDNNGTIPDEPGEPSKGMINRLFAKVRNLGTTPVTNVTVKFAYAPYGIWGWNAYAQFKEISTTAGVSIGAAGSADAEKTIEVQWDLRDLAENNGGLWGGFTVGDFDHFCVWVTIQCPGDADTTNNFGRVNFCNVITVAGQEYSMKFLMFNPGAQKAQGELILKGMPKDWKYEFKGIESQREIIFKPKEFKLTTLKFIAPKDIEEQYAKIAVSLMLNKELIPGITFIATTRKPGGVVSYPPSGGMLSPYSIGTYDLRSGVTTVLQVVNPTARRLWVAVAFFDDKERPVGCDRQEMSANDLWELDVRGYKLDAKFGVMKVISFTDKSEREPTNGIVAFQRQFIKGGLISETGLHGIPMEVLKEDLPRIHEACK